MSKFSVEKKPQQTRKFRHDKLQQLVDNVCYNDFLMCWIEYI